MRKAARTSWLLVLAMLGTAGAWAEGKAAPLRVRPGMAGHLNTWLVCGPFSYDQPLDFKKDFLGGEAKADPAEGDPAGKAHVWTVLAESRVFVPLARKTSAPSESVFYLSCRLRSPSGGLHWIDCDYWAQAALFLDGRPIAAGAAAMSPLIQRLRTPIELEKDREYRLLVKIGSRQRQALVGVQFLKVPPMGRVTAATDLDVTLRVKPATAKAPEKLFFRSLTMVLADGPFVEPGQTAKILLGLAGSAPELPGSLAVKLAIADGKGRSLRQLTIPATPTSDLRKQPLRLNPVLPKDAATPYFVARAECSYGRTYLGELTRRFYSRRHLLVARQALQARLAERRKKGPPAARWQQDAWALLELRLEKIGLLFGEPPAERQFAQRLIEEMESAEELVERLEAGRREHFALGLVERAYLSEIDGRPQPYYVYVPANYTGKTPVPCIVYLHGYTPTLDKLNWEMMPEGLKARAERDGFLVVAPFARSNTDFQGCGEVDVLTVLRRVKERYRIDEDRVFLTGYSMGGMGALTIGAHYPDLWAGVISLCGRADYYLWKDLGRDEVAPFKRHLIDLEFAGGMAENFTALPVYCFQGTDDSLVRPDQARKFIAQLQRLKLNAQLHELPGRDHWIGSDVFSSDAFYRWMKGRSRQRSPARVVYKTFSPRYRQAYWVTVDAFEQFGRPARVAATVQDGNRVILETSNVARVTIQPPLVDPERKLTVMVNGRPQVFPPATRFTIQIVPDRPAAKLSKHEGLAGPLKEVFNSRFILVYGTGAEGKPGPDRRAAERLAQEWQAFTKSRPRLRPDVKITEPDWQNSNLILVGRPETNLVLKRIADRLPIRFIQGGFAVGDRSFRGQEIGLVFIYPNPLNPKRYVAVVSGYPYGEALPPNHKYDLLPDFLIYRRETDHDGTNRWLCAGFFDGAWKLNDRLTWVRPANDKGLLKTPGRPGL